MTTEVIVVGSGPAGAWCALEAAKLGLSVLLVDKADFPRDKPCGGGLSTATCGIVGDIPEDVKDRAIHGVKWWHEGQEKPHSHRTEAPMGQFVLRRKFDDWLRRRAVEEGADFVVDRVETVRDAEDGRVEVVSKGNCYRAKVVIGADGVNSVVARSSGLRKPYKGEEVGIAIEEEIPVADLERYEDVGHIFTLKINGSFIKGYGWVFPKKELANVGIGVMESEARVFHAARDKFAKIVGDHGVKTDLLKPKAWRIPACIERRDVVRGKVMLAGDAAGGGDPFSGEGIRVALESGHLAARAASNYILFGRKLAHYQSDYDAKVWNRLKWAYTLQRMALADLDAIYSMCRDPVANRKFVEAALGVISYKEFLMWLLVHRPGRATAMGVRHALGM